jgi:D-3-phosphoglycerate dehydrogenase / 2-oxoglutarate reductase
LAFGLILALDRRIADNVQQLREGHWNKKEFSKAPGLFGKVLGIVGLGSIGQHMIIRAKAFGMEVIGCDLWLTPEKAECMGIGYFASPKEVAGQCDILTIHVALNSSTRGFIDSTVIDALRPNSYFINTSRGEVVNQAALMEAIDKKGIRAGLDVFAQEPAGSTGVFEDPIVKRSNVYGTHHIGASTDQAQEAIADETVRIVRIFMESGQAPNVVNPA